MKLKWYGHAAFLITSDEGVRILTDPYEPGGFGGAIGYGPIADEADVVLVSHDHADHNHVQGLRGKPQVVKGTGSHRVKGLEFKGIPAYHDGTQGSERGQNTVFCAEIDGVRLCHLGDLGYVPTEQEAAQIGPVDLLLMPVGGLYTIDPKQAVETAQRLKPRITVPMHYKTPKCGFPLANVEEFTAQNAATKVLQGSELEVRKETLPKDPEVIVLQPAL